MKNPLKMIKWINVSLFTVTLLAAIGYGLFNGAALVALIAYFCGVLPCAAIIKLNLL